MGRAEGQPWCPLTRPQTPDLGLLVWNYPGGLSKEAASARGAEAGHLDWVAGSRVVLVARPNELCSTGMSLAGLLPQFPQLN